MPLLMAGIVGLIAESSLVAADLVRYSASWPMDAVAPAWIVALWLAFGTTLESTRRLLGTHPFVKSTLLGLLFGPLTYLAGERLGALAFTQPQWQGHLAVAALWGLAYPGLMKVGNWSGQASGLN
jgi:Protein of unknown function (DUF2878)